VFGSAPNSVAHPQNIFDAVVTAAGVVTGLALLYRELKRLGDDDVLLG